MSIARALAERVPLSERRRLLVRVRRGGARIHDLDTRRESIKETERGN